MLMHGEERWRKVWVNNGRSFCLKHEVYCAFCDRWIDLINEKFEPKHNQHNSIQPVYGVGLEIPALMKKAA